MRRIKFLLFIVCIFAFFQLAAFEKNVFCEPSLIFPEVFLIESGTTFSYTLADTFYQESDALFIYLNHTDFSQEQFQTRYLYYLRTRQFMPALTLLMTMVSLNAYPSSFTDPYKEFFNLLEMAANDINEHSSGGGRFSFEDPDISSENENYVRSLLVNRTDTRPLTAAELSGKMTAELVLNFTAISMRNKKLGEENKITSRTVFLILALSLKSVFSDLENGVYLDDDPFFKELFNRFVAMYKDDKEVLSSFIYNFVEKIYGSDQETGLYRYILLRQLGMIENAGESWLDFEDVRKAVQWIDLVKTKENIRPFYSYFTRDNDSCGYIDEKTDWISAMKHMEKESRKDTLHDLKIAGMIEQCGGLDYIGLEKSAESDPSENTEPEWARYAAYALETVSEKEMSEEEAVAVLEKGLSAVIFSIRPQSDAERDIYEILLFLYRYKERGKVLNAMFFKQIHHGNSGDPADSYSEAAAALDNFLFY